jgi:hypothetical protein
MANPDAIKYELGLTVVGLIVFWVWQTVSLRRDSRKTALEEEQKRQAESTASGSVAAEAKPPDPP